MYPEVDLLVQVRATCPVERTVVSGAGEVGRVWPFFQALVYVVPLCTPLTRYCQ